MELGWVDALSENVGKHLWIRDGVDNAVTVKDDPAEVMEPAEGVLSALGGAALLGKIFDGGAVDEVADRTHDVVTKEAEKLQDVHGAFGGKARGGSFGFGGPSGRSRG